MLLKCKEHRHGLNRELLTSEWKYVLDLNQQVLTPKWQYRFCHCLLKRHWFIRPLIFKTGDSYLRGDPLPTRTIWLLQMGSSSHNNILRGTWLECRTGSKIVQHPLYIHSTDKWNAKLLYVIFWSREREKDTDLNFSLKLLQLLFIQGLDLTFSI